MSIGHYCEELRCLKLVPADRDYCPEHELFYPEMTVTEEHFHKFSIPVEWDYDTTCLGDNNERQITYKRVTKLRCACGEEQVR